MSDICLRVSEVVGEKKSIDTDGLLPLLPEYNCLQLSPARLWYQDKQRYLSFHGFSQVPQSDKYINILPFWGIYFCFNFLIVLLVFANLWL
jgi:hypothetical protein